MDGFFFQLLQHYSHQLHALLRHFFPPPAPTATRRLHLPSGLFPFDSATADKRSLSVPSHLFISADLPVFFNVNTAQTGFPIPHSEAAHTSRCGTRGVKDMTSLA